MRISDWSSDVCSSDLPDFVRLQSLVAERGGSFRNDHAAIRSADPQVCALFVRAARVLGLRRERDYAFPAKKLKPFALQRLGDDATAVKIFVPEVDVGAFPHAVTDRTRIAVAPPAP